MSEYELSPVGSWRPGNARPAFSPVELSEQISRVREPAFIVRDGTSGRVGLSYGGTFLPPGASPESEDYPLMACLPALFPEWLGDRSFGEVHHVRFPYVAGEMANGIATTAMVIAMAKAEMLGFFGAAGLSFERVTAAVDELERALGASASWGVNLIHSPTEPSLEERVADLLITRSVTRISASAFMALTPSVVRCAAAGLSLSADGSVVRKHQIFAKVSRAEVARAFMSPPPKEILTGLVTRGLLTHAEAELAAHLPVAEDVTVEADSGGHTDNQSLVALFPTILALRDDLVRTHKYRRPIRIGAAGGLGTPGAVAAAFALGAAYVVTGSVNQSAIEAGISSAAKAMLCEADVPDVIMAPAADMFELGVKVQVLRRGTLFGPRAAKLYEAYRDHASLEAIPADVRSRLEKDVLHATFDDIWSDTQAFWERRDPSEVARALREPKHRMALVFRWYLGKASRWAIDGDPARRTDFQIWSGPAMGSFNRWAKGSFLESPERRTVAQIAKNLLEGAAVITRAAQLRTYGIDVPSSAFQFRPRSFA